MLLPPGAVPHLSLGGPQHRGRSLVISEDPGVASQIVLELCTIMHGPAPRLHSTKMRRIVHRLAEKSQDIRRKLFEVEFPSAIVVVDAAPFGELYRIFGLLSKLAPLGLAPSTIEPCEYQDIHLGGIFATFGLVCEACYVYHPYDDLLMTCADEAYS